MTKDDILENGLGHPKQMGDLCIHFSALRGYNASLNMAYDVVNDAVALETTHLSPFLRVSVSKENVATAGLH